MESVYLEALTRQARQVRAALGNEVRFARMAIGGGTPTYLSAAGLERLLDLAEGLFGADLRRIPVSVETSPRTADPCKLALLRKRGVDRISIGVQSFVEAEVAAIGRAQRTALVEAAIGNVRDAGFPTLNLDLMFGLPGQRRETWEASLRAALRFTPEEFYLYPLYVRPLTRLGQAPPLDGAAWDEQRRSLYRAACELLGEAGYEQVSMRFFRAAHAPVETQGDGPVYCCQEDNMVGLGCGARSYTRALHYSSEYAVGRAGVKSILADYLARPDSAFAVADYGVRLSAEEQRRRYILYALLQQADGVRFTDYQRHFGTDLMEDLPMLTALTDFGLTARGADALCLTRAGLEWSDAIGPWLYSDAVRATMETFTLR
jgi:oxygen-independent coproporphyrinogen-3 oxidase